MIVEPQHDLKLLKFTRGKILVDKMSSPTLALRGGTMQAALLFKILRYFVLNSSIFLSFITRCLIYT